MRYVIVAAYLGAGSLCHALFVGPRFDPLSAWTWGWLLGWPLALVISFWTIIAAVFAAVFAVVLIVTGFVILIEHVRSALRVRKLREKLARDREHARTKQR